MSTTMAEKRKPYVTRDGFHIVIPYGPEGGGDWSTSMTWPNPMPPGEIGWKLSRGVDLTRSEQLYAAAVLRAYAQLTVEPSLTQKSRNQRVASIREALAAKEES